MRRNRPNPLNCTPGDCPAQPGGITRSSTEPKNVNAHNCTCWSIERFGLPSERESYGDDF